MRDTGEEERKESEKIKDRRMIILEEAVTNSNHCTHPDKDIRMKRKQDLTYPALTTLHAIQKLLQIQTRK